MQETQTGQDGYPLYRRRTPGRGGFTATINMRGQTNLVTIDNKWIVPYCPFLSKTFNAHINVEWCNSVKSIKYVCKYVNKGSDMAMFALQDANEANEVQRFQMGRYVSTSEAIWRIFGFPIHERNPTVVHLAVHLQNGQRVYFHQDANPQQLLVQDTTLTAFFNLCHHDEFANQIS